MNTLPTTSYEEVFASLYAFEGVQPETAPRSATAKDNENSLLADEILAFMQGYATDESDETHSEEPQELEILEDHLVWAGLGHIKDFDNEHYVWNSLGHINKNKTRDEAEAELLLQEADNLRLAGLDEYLDAETAAVRSGTLAESTPTSRINEVRENVSEIHPNQYSVESQSVDEDFDDWSGILQANEERQKVEDNFWAETDAALRRRDRVIKIGQKVVAVAAAIIFAVPAVGKFIDSRVNNKTAKVNLASDVIRIPQIEFSTPTTTVVVENGKVIVTPIPEVQGGVNLSELAQKAAKKAAAEDAAAEAEAAAEAARLAAIAEKQRQKTFGEALLEACDSDEITSPYGVRIHPISGEVKMHDGEDVGCSKGAAIHAPAGGEVILADWYGGYGNTVIIDHGNGFTTLFAHQNKIDVSVGQVVEEGQVIGEVGSTGDSTAAHLHGELRKNGSSVDPDSVTIGQLE